MLPRAGEYARYNIRDIFEQVTGLKQEVGTSQKSAEDRAAAVAAGAARREKAARHREIEAAAKQRKAEAAAAAAAATTAATDAPKPAADAPADTAPVKKS